MRKNPPASKTKRRAPARKSASARTAAAKAAPPEPKPAETAPSEAVPEDKTSKKKKRDAKKKDKKAGKQDKAEKNASKASTGLAATAFPMIAVIDEQIRTSIPPELVERVKRAKSKKEIVSSVYPYKRMMKTPAYEKEIALLQIELVKMQTWVQQTGERIVMIFEGRDAAGKGGTIKRFAENLNPRGARIVALTKPTETERGQWYFQRYVEQLPTTGEIVFLDRSWYNRVGVEHVMGFCTPHEYLEFMRQAPEFERMLVRSGIRLFKFWFSVSREEQLRRFMSRARDPIKQWKLSPMDVESLGRWDEYTRAKEAMLFYTDTADSPWHVVRSDDKKRARLSAIKFLLQSLPYSGRDDSLVKDFDRQIVGSAKEIYEFGENQPMPLPEDKGE